MFYESFLASRGTQYEDQGDDYHPVLDSYELSRWLEEHETVQDYDRGKRLKAREWKNAREEALRRDGFRCMWPDEWHGKRLSVHHVVPLHAGGDPYSLGNLATLCDPRHHILFHPGMLDAYKAFREGDKDAFKKYGHETHSTKKYDPPREADILKGMVMERTMNYIVAKRQHLYEAQDRGITTQGERGKGSGQEPSKRTFILGSPKAKKGA